MNQEKKCSLLEKIDSVISRSEGHRNSREGDFLVSVKSFVAKRGFLTPGQESWLESLNRKFSAENLDLERLWVESFDSIKREQAIVVAHYYRENPPYYASYVHKVFEDEKTFVLTRKEWL